MPAHSKGKRGRKIGKGIDKLKRSRFHTYTNLIASADERERARIEARRCPYCKAVLQSHGARKRHIQRATCEEVAG